MIRKLEDKDIDKVMNIWLESTIKAHDGNLTMTL